MEDQSIELNIKENTGLIHHHKPSSNTDISEITTGERRIVDGKIKKALYNSLDIKRVLQNLIINAGYASKKGSCRRCANYSGFSL